MHKIYILQTLCTTKQAVVSTFGRENRFRRSMGMTLIQSVQRNILWIQLNLKRSKKKTEVLVENDKEQFTIEDARVS